MPRPHTYTPDRFLNNLKLRDTPTLQDRKGVGLTCNNLPDFSLPQQSDILDMQHAHELHERDPLIRVRAKQGRISNTHTGIEEANTMHFQAGRATKMAALQAAAYANYVKRNETRPVGDAFGVPWGTSQKIIPVRRLRY